MDYLLIHPLIDYLLIHPLIVYLVIPIIHLYYSSYSLLSNLYNLRAFIIGSDLAERSIRTVGSFRYSRNTSVLYR